MMTQRIEVRLPDVGDIDAATVTEWCIAVGEPVMEGDDLVEVETEKTTFIIPAPASGVLVETMKPVGEAVKADDVLGAIES